MSTPAEEETIIGTFADVQAADAAASAARKAGFQVERRSGGAVAVQTGQRHMAAEEIGAIFAAYGAREYGGGSAAGSTAAQEQRTRAEAGAKVELLEEQLTPHTRPVQTGEVTIRKETRTETRTIEVPVRREELIIERHSVDRAPVDTSSQAPADPLVEQLLDRLRHLKAGETLRIPIIEEEVVIQKRPVVVEEITLGKRTIEDVQELSDTVKREEVRIEEHGDARIHRL
jgi:uncharacterized protein (TIGR02271 family)